MKKIPKLEDEWKVFQDKMLKKRTPAQIADCKKSFYAGVIVLRAMLDIIMTEMTGEEGIKEIAQIDLELTQHLISSYKSDPERN